MANLNSQIRPVAQGDGAALADIYNHYIANTLITFEEQPLDASDMTGRIDEVAAAALPWLVAERQGRIVGYAHASRWKGRCAYRFTVESTVYLDPVAVGQGVGSQLYRALLDRLRDRAIHVAIAGIALPNPASVALHERFGVRKVGHFQEVGFKFDRWIDVGYWQVLL